MPILNNMAAWQVEENDSISLAPSGDDLDSIFQVVEVGGTRITVDLTLTDDEGNREVFHFKPGDGIRVVVSWDDPVDNEE